LLHFVIPGLIRDPPFPSPSERQGRPRIKSWVTMDEQVGLGRLDRLLEPREPRACGGGVGADPAVVDILDRDRVQMIPAFAAAAFGE
jgi:hypothetical protein